MRFVFFIRWVCLIGFLLGMVACTAPSPDKVSKAEVTSFVVPEKDTRRSTFADLPGWDKDRVSEAMPAFLHSCRVLKKKAEWREICQIAEKIGKEKENEARTFFETYFEPQQIILENGSEIGTATGYYEPILYGSRIRHAQYQTPIYRVPLDLIVVNLETVYPQLKGMRLRGRLKGRRIVPYLTRSEIRQSHSFAGQEIVWVDNAIDAFFLHVQGSGRVALAENREIIRLSYADQNGHPYRPIGKYLIDKGEIKREDMSAQAIKQWLKENPERLNEVLDINSSYIFFQEEKLDNPHTGPKGAMGVPLTEKRSVAIDPRHIPLGSPLFIDTISPDNRKPLQRVVMAQDTGAAIKGSLRLDYFWGSGNEAGELAGKMKHPVRIWILQPKQTVK